MIEQPLVLVATAASIGVVHTLLGPDHYLPFVALAAARRWSTVRTLALTALCGLGHVTGSLLLGAVGIAASASLPRMLGLEASRGPIAGGLLLGFGLAYGAWGLWRAYRHRPHAHAGSTRHVHGHFNVRACDDDRARGASTAWALFVVFVFGPCEPLIPLMMVPAAERRWSVVVAVVGVFAVVTIATMLAIVWLLTRGVQRIVPGAWSRFGHATAGAAICMCALAMLILGA